MTDLRYALHGVTIALAWFGLINVAVAAIVALVARDQFRRATNRSAAFWLMLRLLPAIAAIAFVVVLFAPSYWRYEPRAVEDLDVSLIIAALAATLLIAVAVVRGWRARARAASRARAWLRIARRIDIAAGIPVYEVPIDAPMMALSGICYLAQGWIIGSSGFSSANQIPTLLGIGLILVWTVWLLIAALRIKTAALPETTSDATT